VVLPTQFHTWWTNQKENKAIEGSNLVNLYKWNCRHSLENPLNFLWVFQRITKVKEIMDAEFVSVKTYLNLRTSDLIPSPSRDCSCILSKPVSIWNKFSTKILIFGIHIRFFLIVSSTPCEFFRLSHTWLRIVFWQPRVKGCPGAAGIESRTLILVKNPDLFGEFF